MGFTHIYINPIFETGFSKSLYAPKDFMKISEEFMDLDSELSAMEQLREFIVACHEYGLKVILEIILTHVAIDSEMIFEHPEWFKYENGNLKKYSLRDKERWFEWGDLVEFDNEGSRKKEELWQYWENIAKHYIELGVDGFKAEAAYKVPAELWKRIILFSKEINSNFTFIAENLGATFGEMISLSRAGFDYMFTSLRWWDFKSAWLLEQHYEMKEFVEFISFPEYYNIDRLASIHKKNINAQKAWYVLAALFNKGVMMCHGYEFGYINKMDIINSSDEDYETKNFDIREFIRKVNNLKKDYEIFNEENDIYIINSDNQNLFAYKKVSLNKKEEILFIMNRNFENEEEVCFNNLKTIIDLPIMTDISPEFPQEFVPETYYYKLSPGEVKILHGRKN